MINIFKAIRTRKKVISKIKFIELRQTNILYILSLSEPQPGFNILQKESKENESKIELLKSLL